MLSSRKIRSLFLKRNTKDCPPKYNHACSGVRLDDSINVYVAYQGRSVHPICTPPGQVTIIYQNKIKKKRKGRKEEGS